MKLVSRFPLALYRAELIVVHCRRGRLAQAIQSLPSPLPVRLKSYASDLVVGFAEYVDHFGKPTDPVLCYAVIYIDASQPKSEQRLTAVHEAAHVAVRIFGAIDQPITGTTDEPFAYLVEWATDCVWKACRLV